MNKISISENVRGLIKVAESQWWIKGFQKLNSSQQAIYYIKCRAWIAADSKRGSLLEGTSANQKRDIEFILAADIWGQEENVRRDEERIQAIRECHGLDS